MGDERVPTLEELEQLETTLRKFGNAAPLWGRQTEAADMLRRLRLLVERADAEARILAAGALYVFMQGDEKSHGVRMQSEDVEPWRWFLTASEAAAWADEQAAKREQEADAKARIRAAGAELVRNASAGLPWAVFVPDARQIAQECATIQEAAAWAEEQAQDAPRRYVGR